MNADPQAAEICQRYFQGRSVLPPRKGTGSWDPSTVNAILHRELYRGTIVWGKHRNVDKGGRTRCRSRQAEADWLRVDLPELRIVSEELWAAVQERRRDRNPTAAPTPSHTSASLFSGLALCASCGGPFTISGSRKRERCYGCSWHRNRGTAVCDNSLLESVNIVDRRLIEEIERQVLTPEARRFVVAAAEEAIRRRGEKTADTTADVRNSLSRVTREIENLLRAVEHGDAPATLIARLRHREREQTELRVKLTAQGPKNASELDARRVRRLIEDGLSRLGEVLASDTAAARHALVGLLADKIHFTPTELPSGERTYRFDAKLAMGRLLGCVAQNSVGVPDGI